MLIAAPRPINHHNEARHVTPDGWLLAGGDRDVEITLDRGGDDHLPRCGLHHVNALSRQPVRPRTVEAGIDPPILGSGAELGIPHP